MNLFALAMRLTLLFLLTSHFCSVQRVHALPSEYQDASVPVTITTSSGRIRGMVLDKVQTFLGIPFAEPPLAKLRFAQPVWHRGWTETRDVFHSAEACVQGYSGQGSEDCLYMNAFSPSNGGIALKALAPVLVYIHGGAFYAGSAREDNFTNLVRLTGAVVFMPQYRLGPLGFFSPSSSPENFGLQDQQLALRWVRANARAFGGDPARVMITGCSAGGASVAGHLVLRSSWGLYSAAAMQSPGAHLGWQGGDYHEEDDWVSASMIMDHSNRMAQTLRCRGADDLLCLQALPVEDIIKASLLLRFAPSLPQEGQYPLALMRRGEWSQVPLIIGEQSCESCGKAQQDVGPPVLLSRSAFEAALVMNGLSGVNGSKVGPQDLESWYSQRISSEGRWRTLARILSDGGHACSSKLHAEAAVEGGGRGKVWRYFFTHVPAGATLPGALHGESEPFILNNVESPTEGEAQLMQAMGRWWVALASHGDPNIQSAKYLGGNNSVHWSAYSGEAQLLPSSAADVMILDVPPKLGCTPDTVRQECEHWKRYLGWESSVPPRQLYT